MFIGLAAKLTYFSGEEVCLSSATKNHPHLGSYTVLHINLQDEKRGHYISIVDLDNQWDNALLECQ